MKEKYTVFWEPMIEWSLYYARGTWDSNMLIRDFSVGPIVKTPASNAAGLGLFPGQGTKIPPAAQSKKKFFFKVFN